MKIFITIASLVLLITCACWISGPVKNVSELFLLIFMPEKFIKLSVDDSIAKEKETNKGFQEQFDKDKDYREGRIKEFSSQFSDATNKLRNNIFESFSFVFLITFVAFILAMLVKKYISIGSESLALIQVFSSFLILCGVLGQLGWSIQTLSGTTLPELINDYYFRLVNCLGIGLFFFSCFYQILGNSIVGKSDTSNTGSIIVVMGIIGVVVTNFVRRVLVSKHKINMPSLSEDEILTRLQIKDERIVDEIYEITGKQLTGEEERRSKIDSKSNNLAGMIGVYLSVLFGLKGLQTTTALVDTASGISFYLYIAVCILAAIALMFSLLAARARSDHRTIGELDVFNAEEIDQGIIVYKRYMAAHYWFVYKNNYAINERKAMHLKRAYFFFFLAVFLLTSLTIINTCKAHERNAMTQKNTNSNDEEKPKKTGTPSAGDLHTASEKTKKTSKPSDGRRLTESKE